MSLDDETFYYLDSNDEFTLDDDTDVINCDLTNVTLPKRNNEVQEYYYEILSTEKIVEYMINFIRDANDYVDLPETITRILLNYFKWDKQKFVNSYYNEDQENLFEKAHVINPFKKYYRINQNHPTSNQKSSNVTEECQVCFVEIPKDMMTGLDCGHQFCADCWNEYLKIKIMDEGIVQTIQCAAHSCNILIDDANVMKLVKDPKVKQKYQHLITNDFVECNKLMKWCPTPGCESVIMVQCVEMKPVRCKCNHTFCFNCGKNWHDPVSCKLLYKWNKYCNEELESNNWILKNAKNCPKCDAPIEKNGGCNHMSCRNKSCNYQFCWMCFGAWSSHHGCNVFNEEKVRSKEKSKAQLDILRYTFFNKRYMNHMQSLKYENQLHGNVMAKMEEAQQHHDMTWNEVNFLQTAVEILVSCRQTLMYTYIFAFYVEKNYQTEIFEYNQNDLENAVEILSGYLERDIVDGNLTQLKPKIQDKYKYCDSRRKVLLEHVHEGNDKEWWDL